MALQTSLSELVRVLFRLRIELDNKQRRKLAKQIKKCRLLCLLASSLY